MRDVRHVKLVGIVMDEKQIQEVVAEVLKRLLPYTRADGEAGNVIAVFSGATVGFSEALQQIRSLAVRGHNVQLAFSPGAEHLYARFVWEQLQGFPDITAVDPSKWLRTIKEARAVIVPMLSVNTLSKLSLLLADNLASNLILHALFNGKPVVLARNGVNPSDEGRVERHFDQCTPGVAVAIEERLQVAQRYGCQVTDVGQLTTALQAALEPKPISSHHGLRNGFAARPPLENQGSIVTAADVLQAHHAGAQLWLRASAVITPLARELAAKHGVCLLQESR